MTNTNKPNTVFWIIGVITLIWNGLGIANYLQQAYKPASFLENFSADQITLLDGLPVWMTALFAIAVFAGTLGCVALLLRKKIAVVLFLMSFLAATVQQLYWIFGTNATEVFSESLPYTMPILVIIVAAFLVWYSKDQKRKGILA